jgi:hypothetical protein
MTLSDTYPPQMAVEFQNAGGEPIGRVHFRLVFHIGERPLSRADEDHVGFEPGRRRTIILRSHATDTSSRPNAFPARARYQLIVIPEWRKQLPAITGEVILNR